MALIKILILYLTFWTTSSPGSSFGSERAQIVSLQSKQILFSNFTSSESFDERINYVTLKPLDKGGRKHKFDYKFECTGASPVQWRYEGYGLPSVVPYTRRTLEDIRDFQDASKYRFTATLFVGHNEKATGKYICQGTTEDQNSSVAAYIFFPGEKFFILDSSETALIFRPTPREEISDTHSLLSFHLNNTVPVIIETAEPQQWITIPCAGSSFSTSDDVRLYKLIQNGSAFLSLKKGDTVHFDPFLGFRLRSSYPWGDYICNFKDDPSSLSVSIRPKDDASYLDLSIVSVQFDSSFNETTEEDQETSDDETLNLNCSTTYPNVHIQHVACHSVMDCNFRKIVLQNSFVPLEVVPSEGSVLVSYPTSRQTSVPMKGSHPQTTLVLPVTGIFYCSAGWQRIRTLTFVRLRDNTISVLDGFHDTLGMDRQELRAHQSILVGGTDASFTCLGSTLFFSNGFLWKAVMADGQEEWWRGNEKLGAGKDFIENSVRISIPQNGGRLRSLTCFAPVWDSNSNWANTTMELGSGAQNAGLTSSSGFHHNFLAFMSIQILSLVLNRSAVS